MIYAHLGYVCTSIPNLPWPSAANAPTEYHATDSIILSISHP